jgi:hypothetical protein
MEPLIAFAPDNTHLEIEFCLVMLPEVVITPAIVFTPIPLPVRSSPDPPCTFTVFQSVSALEELLVNAAGPLLVASNINSTPASPALPTSTGPAFSVFNVIPAPVPLRVRTVTVGSEGFPPQSLVKPVFEKTSPFTDWFPSKKTV